MAEVELIARCRQGEKKVLEVTYETKGDKEN
jgi:hypothetical protein